MRALCRRIVETVESDGVTREWPVVSVSVSGLSNLRLSSQRKSASFLAEMASPIVRESLFQAATLGKTSQHPPR